ncbi:MAG: adenosylcobinamide amidohydrolase, partial [Porphyromonadaceae bacterium]|nr:adenosylcobinamide amidohydrolase [Porphyromonadaceae bacterium]
MIISFAGRRGVVSSSNLNGGYRNDLHSVFNHSVGRDPNILQKRCPGLKGANIIEHYAVIASELGLDPEHTTGMGTAALIENHARAERTYHGVTVQAIATAGIDVNGGRAGDKASYDEFEQRSLLPPPG